ncbi:MAG: SDR family NAD(P)-dependent oxidoreductase [Lachnospiraceae bacterium]|nr:SDR family NAD(P)-dependent oxidoreductase [Lachnospiraceae bacterium]
MRRKTAIITGAATGLGSEFAKYLALRVAGDPNTGFEEIWLIDRDAEELRKTAAVVQKIAGRKDASAPVCRYFSMEFEDDDYKRYLRALLNREKPYITWLIQCEDLKHDGDFSVHGSAAEADMVRINCEALTYICHEALPYFYGESHILLPTAADAFLPHPGSAVYTASKTYVFSFGLALAKELQHRNIHVTLVCPGMGVSCMVDHLEDVAGGSDGQMEKMFLAGTKDVVVKAVKDAREGKNISLRIIPTGALRAIRAAKA